VCHVNLLLYTLQARERATTPLMNLRNPVKAAVFPEKELRALTGC
jgi:hypothetical protein